MHVHGLYENDHRQKEKAMELLANVNLLPQHFYPYLHEFSGGQGQRIGIAWTLAVEPRLMICDESVSALDISIQARVLNMLMQLREAFQLTYYVFISHDLSVVGFMSNPIAVMNKGCLEEIGSADQIYAHPQTAYTRKLIAAIPNGNPAIAR